MPNDITWVEAEAMHAAYLNHPDKLMTESGSPLKALAISVDDMRQIIDRIDINNDPLVKDVLIMFGVKLDELEAPQNEQFFTTIIVGVDQNDTILNDRVYEYCRPCPPTCATGMPT